MGYTTQFEGRFWLNRPLFDSQALYLLEFSRTRRVKRSAAALSTIPDLGREAVDLPLGEEGGYFINESHPQAIASIFDENRPPTDRGQIVVMNNQIVQPEQASMLLAIAKAPDFSTAHGLARTLCRSCC